MRRAWRGLAVLALLAALAAGPGAAQAQPAPTLALAGHVEHPATLGLDALRALPAVTIEITRPVQGQAPRTTSYTGALLWSLVSAARPVHEAGPHSHLRHTILAQGRDGYAVSVAIGEIDPEFEGKQVLVAVAQDGKPLPDLRLVVPGDVRAGRSVRDLVSIEVR